MDLPMIALSSLLVLHTLMRAWRTREIPFLLLLLYPVLVGVAQAVDSWFFTGPILLVALWRTVREFQADSDPLAKVRKALKSVSDQERVAAIRQLQELGTSDARTLLLDHFGESGEGEHEQDLLVVLRTLLDGWGLDPVLAHWSEIPEAARAACLDGLMGHEGFSSEEVLKLTRQGMDEGASVAAAGWRTYAHTVTAGFDQRRKDFDVPRWLQESLSDSNGEVQGLRSHMEQRRLAEVKSQGIESLVARYRREVFIHPPATSVRLRVAVEVSAGETTRIPVGVYEGLLSGKFDNAQNAVAEGWPFVIELKDVNGQTRRITTTWQANEFFSEILDGRHDALRTWFEDAPEELVQAFANQPFVGPVVTYGDGWNAHKPKIAGEILAIGGQQLLKCLVAMAPASDVGLTRLAFLLYAVEDGENEGDELRPFVTTIALERMLLEASEGDGVDAPTTLIE